ncbi:metallophosphoesterase [Spongiivirga citrea]|uniref:Metallophosphoesterase n=1 Tax=Spongiivirga citrea TaxID=1481457 RepID=A0A6M0CIH3_9FLAO|nr:metallophosphoesterase [Spongiivirga citrea]NER15739.1 metallophosphoesterase [Spongiivirga citrea]
MRSYSLVAIILLCLAILTVDILTFYWLQSITQLIASSLFIKLIKVAFWVFSIGLITAILVLKIRLDSISTRRKHLLISSLYGLTVSSFIPKIIFVIVITVLYATNYVLSDKESLIAIPLVGLFSGFLPFFVIIYGVFRSLYRFKVHRVRLALKALPRSFDGLRIVQISDIHLGSFNSRYHIFDRAVKLINDLNPDLIFFTGDLVNNYAWELKGWKSTFEQLVAKQGKYAVLGNHDYGDYSEWKSDEDRLDNFNAIKIFINEIGFKLLLNEAEIVNNNNEQIAIVGVENWGSPPFKQYGNLGLAMIGVTQIPFKILLSHDPTHWKEEVAKATNIDLTLSGHTHGMQAGINLKTKKWSPIKYKYEHWAGLYDSGDQYLYVNRGLGWLGFPGRLGMRPEITFIELKTA